MKIPVLNRNISLPGGSSSPARWAFIPVAAAGAAIGAAAEFLLDPEQGKRRRHQARDRVLALVRRGRRETARRADYAAGKAQGAAYTAAKATTGASEETPGDRTLASKVESIVFRETGVPKDAVDVDAHEGTVVLRGEVKRPEQINALVEATEEVEGVQRVESLLQTPR
jgi:osmotically-inducible protein OsmY